MLAEEINRRGLQKRFFNYQQILTLLFLQQNNLDYQYLTTKNILFNQNHIKLVDPLIIDTFSNLQTVFNNRNVKNIYLSPQECKLIQNQNTLYCFNYKNVVFTLGILILEICLLDRQDQCYLQNCSQINLEALQMNLKSVQNKYGKFLYQLLSNMLKIDKQCRSQFQQINIKLDEAILEQKRKFKRIKTAINLQSVNQHEMSIKSNKIRMNQANINKPFMHYSQSDNYNHACQSRYNHPINKYFIDSSKNQIPTFLYKPSLIHQMKKQPHHSALQSQQMSPFRHELTTNHQQAFISSSHIIFSKQKLAHLSTQGVLNSDSEMSQSNQSSLKIKTMKYKQKDEIKFRSQGNYVIEQFKFGSRYQGYKVKGQRQGHGVFYFQDGGKYEGGWLNNKMHGFGRLYYKSGLLAYQGHWQFDQFHGLGKVFNQNPMKLYNKFNYTNFDNIGESWISYQGNFKHDIKQGKGKLILSNGDYYQGNFQCDQISGEGIFFQMPNKIIKGIWKSNRLIRQI